MENKQVVGLGSSGGIYTDVWTPAAGKKIVLAGVILNCPESQGIEFFEKVDTTRVSLFKLSVPAGGIIQITLPGELILPADHILEIHVKTTTQNCGVNAFGHEE